MTRRKLSSALGQKVDQAKKDLSYDKKIDQAQEKLNRLTKPKSFTLAAENIERIDRKAAELNLERAERVTASSLLNAILDEVFADEEFLKNLTFKK